MLCAVDCNAIKTGKCKDVSSKKAPSHPGGLAYGPGSPLQAPYGLPPEATAGGPQQPCVHDPAAQAASGSAALAPAQLGRREVHAWMARASDVDCIAVLRSLHTSRAALFDKLDAQVDRRSSLQELDVVDWLLMAEGTTVEKVLLQVAASRGSILAQVLDSDNMKPHRLEQQAAVGKPMGLGGSGAFARRDQAAAGRGGHTAIQVDADTTDGTILGGGGAGAKKGEMAIVALASLSYFSTEGEPFCSIDVMRLGDLSGVSKVNYRTKDWSAQAGKTYEAVAGTLVFEPGDSLQEFQVPLNDDDEWNTTLEFIVELLADGAVGCMIDQYLSSAKVKVIDNDAFPTNKYKDAVLSDRFEAIPSMGLMIEYFKLNMQNPIVRKGTIKMALVDQLHNMFFVFKLFTGVYLVDYVLKPSIPNDDLVLIKDKKGSLVGLLIATLIPFAIIYVLCQRKFSWRVAGTCRNIIQKSLLRKFLNYDESSRTRVDISDLVMAMTRDAYKLVHDGYMQMLELMQECGKIVLILGFQFTAPLVFDKDAAVENQIAPAVLFPALLTSFLYCRRKKTTRCFVNMNKMQDELVSYVQSTAENYRLIADYNARAKYVDRFEVTIKTFNLAFTACATCLFNNLYFPKAVTTVIIAMYTVYGGGQLIDGVDGKTLGMFLAEVNVFTQLGEAWGSIYKVLLEIQTCFPALERITRLENLPTDVPTRSSLSLHNRRKTALLRDEMMRALVKTGAMKLDVDNMPIQIKNLQLDRQKANHTGCLEANQGQLVALVGTRGQGKATLLKVISGVILPRTDVEDPGFFMPSHLRVLHISLEPLFVRGTLFDNLAFGVKMGTEDGSPARAKAICRKLGMDEDTVAMIDSDDVQDWGATFSQTQKYMVQLCRAFIANPEVMCIHKPTQVFDDQMSEKIMKCMIEYVQKKGLEVDPDAWHLRRPRTCLFTSAEQMNVTFADSVVHVSKSHGIRSMRKEDVTPDMLC